MATTENNYTASGSQTLYSFTFPYIDTTDIKVSVDSVVQTLTTHYTLASATQIQFNTAPSASAKIKIYRDTDTENKKATFFSGSAIRSQDLNEDFDQVLYTAQELRRDLGNIWDDTTETLDSTETFVDSDDYIMTAAAIEDRIIAGAPTVSGVPTLRTDGGNKMTGDINLDNQKEMRWYEADANGDHYIGWKAPAAVTANKVFTLPDGFPSVSGHALKSDTSGVMSWGTAGGAAGPGSDQIFWENDQTCSDDYTITNNKNAGSFGPITVASGKTVTVGAGEVWTVV
tara:strand:- start:217 stop:1074 length:858 start_codon:yes stop_codon:yes gene_type:complete